MHGEGGVIGLGRAFDADSPALIAYLMAGYPDREASLDCARAAVDAGSDLIELGVPYGDPLADGPVIRQAGRASLAGGFSLSRTLALARELTGGVPGGADGGLPPVALMTYYNPVLQLGLERTASEALSAGVEGFIIPDLPPDAADEWMAASRGLDTVFLIAPTSTDDRLAVVAERSRGFIYAVSSLGVTGERATLPESLPDMVARAKSPSGLPVAVGFGVGTPDMAAQVGAFADGVVVGSAIVARQGDSDEVAAFVASLAEAVHSARLA